MTVWGQALRRRWDDNKRRAEELPPGSILCGPFSTRLQDWIITDSGLFTRTKRKSPRTRNGNLVFGIISIGFVVVAISMAVMLGNWTVIISPVVQVIVVIGIIIWQLIPHGYRQVMEIRDNRIVVGKRDCGPLSGAYVQPVGGLTFSVMLYTSAFPRGVKVTSVNTRQDLEMLCANLMMYLHLDGHHDGDWPPRPERDAQEAGSQPDNSIGDAHIDARDGENG